ncbi:MAG: transcriptional repressor [Flavobacteriales bacterium]|nr:transcriptional repressor [Flavobacteriales bacterium]
MDTASLLREHGLRVTDARLAVLELLQGSPRALAQHDVESALPGLADRVTLFRVLQAFEEAGLAHRVMDAEGVACYAACADGCDTHRHQDTHAHFRCVGCGAVYCLEQVTMPAVKLPKGFKLTGSHLDLEGRCKGCA